MEYQKKYFDFVYSNYAIGWTTDLENKLLFEKSYFDESWFTQPMIGESNAFFCSRKISTYINALSKAGRADLTGEIRQAIFALMQISVYYSVQDELEKSIDDYLKRMKAENLID